MLHDTHDADMQNDHSRGGIQRNITIMSNFCAEIIYSTIATELLTLVYYGTIVWLQLQSQEYSLRPDLWNSFQGEGEVGCLGDSSGCLPALW